MVLNNGNNYLVAKTVRDAGEGLTVSDIEYKTGQPNSTVYRSIQALVKEKILLRNDRNGIAYHYFVEGVILPEMPPKIIRRNRRASKNIPQKTEEDFWVDSPLISYLVYTQDHELIAEYNYHDMIKTMETDQLPRYGYISKVCRKKTIRLVPKVSYEQTDTPSYNPFVKKNN